MVTPRPVPQHGDTPLRAALYGRASVDPHKRGRSIADQFADSRAECAARGWLVHGEYEDRDRSASLRATKRRENYERMVADIEAGQIDVIVYAERSRANRSLDGYVKLRQLCMRTGVLWCYDGELYDLRRSRDRQITGQHALASEGEADAIADRAERTARLNAQRGNPHAHVPFGFKRRYDPDDGHLIGQFPHPVDADTLRNLFKLADEKHSYHSILKVARETQPRLTLGGLKLMLRNKAYIGVRVHRGTEYKAQWDALVDVSVFQRVQVRMDETSGPRWVRNTENRRQLTGMALCGVCRAKGHFSDAPLRFRGTRRGMYKPRYACTAAHVSCGEDMLNAYVEEAVLAWLRSPAARAAFLPAAVDGDLEREATRLRTMEVQLEQARLQATTFDPVTGLPELSVASLAAIESQLAPQILKAKKRVRDVLSFGDPLLESLMSAEPECLDEMWSEGLDEVQQRHILRQVVRVELLPALSKGPNQFIDSRRVPLLFPGMPGFAEWPRPAEL